MPFGFSLRLKVQQNSLFYDDDEDENLFFNSKANVIDFVVKLKTFTINID